MRYAMILFPLAVLGAQAAEIPAAELLFQAIQRADTAAVKRLLDQGVSAGAVDPDGVPALMAATLFGGADCVKLLLDRGANPNAAMGNGATALMWAMPDLEKARLLVAHGAEVNARSNNQGRTPLLIAAGMPASVETLRFLLEKGADLRARDRGGEHALGFAARTADVDVVRFLVERGIDANEPGGGNVPALVRAVSRQYLPTIEFLLSKGGKIRKNDLRLATHWQDPKLIERLIAAGGDVNGRAGTYQLTPLIYAASSDQAGVGTLKLLLEKGADPNVADTDGERPLDWARHRSDQPKIELLKQHGAMEGSTPRDKTYPRPEGVADARVSVERSIALLLPAGPAVFQKRACISCHQQTMPALAAAAAREHGVPVDEGVAKKNLAQILATYKPTGDEAMQNTTPGGGEVGIGYAVMALAAEKRPLDRMTAGWTHVVAARQMPDGSWPETTSRPPLEYSNITRTAMAVRTLTLYPVEGLKKEIEGKLARARGWLLAARPQSAEEHAMRLMGLAWTKASRKELDTAAREWIAQQRADGGWAQLPQLESDAYGTGITLFALHEAGVPVSDAAYRRGVQFLLKNQYQDGSWFVKTRAFPVQPQMESGYPFGYNQWISAAGASWASIAIAYTLPGVRL